MKLKLCQFFVFNRMFKLYKPVSVSCYDSKRFNHFFFFCVLDFGWYFSNLSNLSFNFVNTAITSDSDGTFCFRFVWVWVDGLLWFLFEDLVVYAKETKEISWVNHVILLYSLYCCSFFWGWAFSNVFLWVTPPLQFAVCP